MDGVTISLRLTSDAPCPDCNGTGGKPGTKPHICPECEGAGFVVASVGGAFSMNETCPACGGRQLVYDEPCPTCHGSGRGMSARTIQARIPAGVKDGQRIRLKGKGAAGENGGPAGDLYVTVKVARAPPVRPQGRRPDPRRTGVLRRAGPRRRHQDPDPRRHAGHPEDPRRHAQRPHLPGARQGRPPLRRHLRRRCWRPCNVHVPGRPRRRRHGTPSQAYRDATAGKPLRANLFESAS